MKSYEEFLSDKIRAKSLYTSKIVNVGIQSGGIQTAVPEVISKEDMNNILVFTKDDNEILDKYKLVGNTMTKQEEKTIEKYLGTDYQLEPNTIYVLNDITEEQEQELEKILKTP